MSANEQAISPLCRRMIEDMTIRKFAQKTQHDYVRRVKDFRATSGGYPVLSFVVVTKPLRRRC
jgi:integrase/recombinase XerD